MDFAPLGEQEMEVLRYIAEHAPVTAGQVAEGFGEQRGLARTTVLTVMERLRRKGYLTRQRRKGVFQYSPQMAVPEVLQGLLHRFVQTSLGGSLAPVVAYLTRAQRLTPEELQELRLMVESMKAEGEGADE